MASVVIPIPLEAMPDCFRRAVRAIPGTNVIEVFPDTALVARRTNLAFRSETTRLTFRSHPSGGTEVSAVATRAGATGFANYPGATLELGRKILDELVRESRRRRT